MNNKKIIIIFGLTGSGKSSMANMLAKEFNLRVIHPSSILKELLQGKHPHIKNSKEGTGFWESHEGIKLFKERLDDKYPLDFTCDKILLKEIEKGDLVMDSWTMPWLAKDGMKIRLNATIPTRAKRLAKRSNISIQEAKRAISLRDNATRHLYLNRFDIKKDNHVFDLVIKTDTLSQEEILQKILEKIYEKNYSQK
jgi:cytidylate kinase